MTPLTFSVIKIFTIATITSFIAILWSPFLINFL